ncbi:MAG: hypothetical protein JWN03_4561 [Nocardia sp.]|uniref:hypothetical protein n=1 Tax=Nocardia sp. TaxID=1821 RepID=UPI0026207F99|nr:hypothetical protein [Nocardia sp.]MCU1644286.1 hypothetical protein [Nocardia sp.]
MEIRLLGGPTGGNGSPRLWATDRDSIIVQGWRTGKTPGTVEIPHQLLGFLELETCLGAALHNTGYGTFTLCGEVVDDPHVLSAMQIPDHETAVEVRALKASYPHALSLRIR